MTGGQPGSGADGDKHHPDAQQCPCVEGAGAEHAVSARRSSTSASTPSGVPTTSAVSPACRQKSGPGTEGGVVASTATIETP